MSVGVVVREPFGEYVRGTVILDETLVQKVLSGPNEGSVVTFTPSDAIAPRKAAPAPEAKAEPVLEPEPESHPQPVAPAQPAKGE